jgi:hypothetical protein
MSRWEPDRCARLDGGRNEGVTKGLRPESRYLLDSRPMISLGLLRLLPSWRSNSDEDGFCFRVKAEAARSGHLLLAGARSGTPRPLSPCDRKPDRARVGHRPGSAQERELSGIWGLRSKSVKGQFGPSRVRIPPPPLSLRGDRSSGCCQANGFSSTSATPWPDPTQTPRTP